MEIYVGLMVAISVYIYANLPKEVSCQDCDFQGRVLKTKRGSWGVELGLWFTLILPGLLYSMWRAYGNQFHCSECASGNVIASKNRLAPVEIYGPETADGSHSFKLIS